MKHAILIAACLTATPLWAADFQTGLSELSLMNGERELKGFLWYPTLSDAAPREMLNNPVWRGVDVVEDAEPAPGPHPLVVLSHGMYGNAMNQAWLADALAEKGYVVAAISHPGTSTWARDADDARMLWERPRDISAVIDGVLATPESGVEIDPDRIFMAGHSLGGWTAVALAGGRFEPEKFDTFCADDPEELVCAIMSGWNVAKTPEDREAIAVDLSDPRIKGFAVFDLGGTQTYATESLGAIDRPMLVYGAPRDIDGTGLDLDIESRALVAALPEATTIYEEPPTLSHFDFLGICTPDALEIMKEESPDDLFVCKDGQEARMAEHDMIVNQVDAFFAGL